MGTQDRRDREKQELRQKIQTAATELFVIDGYSHAEIAGLLNISIGTSKSNLFKAKEILQKNITEFFETKKA